MMRPGRGNNRKPLTRGRNAFRLAVVSLALLALSASCIKRPEGVLSDKEMVPVVADLELAEAYVQMNPQSFISVERKEALVEGVIKKHGLTKAQFDSTMAWYGRNIDAYRDLYEQVDRELARRHRKISGSGASLADSEDLWPYSRHAMLSRLSGESALNFSIPTGAVGKGEMIELKMRLNKSVDAASLIGVEYDNNTKVYLTNPSARSRSVSLKLQTDSARTVRRIFGHLFVNDPSQLPLWIDSIYLHTLPFDSAEYYRVHSQRTYSPPARRVKRTVTPEAADSLGVSAPSADRRGDADAAPDDRRPILGPRSRLHRR